MTEHTPGPWDYVASTENHGPYVTSQFGSTICDCYVMSDPTRPSIVNGGPSRPISFMHEMADPNARLIAAAPELLAELKTSYCPGDFTRTVEECMASRECGCSSGAAVAKATEPRP